MFLATAIHQTQITINVKNSNHKTDLESTACSVNLKNCTSYHNFIATIDRILASYLLTMNFFLKNFFTEKKILKRLAGKDLA